ncbi:MAG: polyphenol oxidase family protein [Deltaproteobacteria bacterium]|nr:polyphenol oxidase family protein [Deltaproteobacteria bacterium]
MKPLPHFVQSPALRAARGVYHAFLGVDPVPGRGRSERLPEVFSISAESVGTLRQVHSAAVLRFEPGDGDVPGGRKREGDALWTADRGTGVGVHTADCVPILLSHREIPLAVAIHAGWRGLAGGIAAGAVRAVSSAFGEKSLSGLVAAAGPCALGCCYEVGDETAEALSLLRGATGGIRPGAGPGKWMADLRAIALSELAAAGVPAGQAEGVGPCTICSPEFHSYRREKSLTGRQLSFIYIRETS